MVSYRVAADIFVLQIKFYETKYLTDWEKPIFETYFIQNKF